MLIVTEENIGQHAALMRQAYALRHRVFVEEMGWEGLRRSDGLEVDQFDDARAVHMLHVAEGRVLGYQRMLPTTQPHLLSEVLPQLCEGERPTGPHIWEWTRYCVEPGHRERGRKLSPVALSLLTGIVEWALPQAIDTIIIEMDPMWLLRLVQLHFRVTPLGLPTPMEGRDVLAVTARFDRLTLARLHEMADPLPLAKTG